MQVLNDLPKILYIIGKDDAGEDGAARCPHCGAEGRYTYVFMTEKGTMGAMAGCIKLFPMHRFARDGQRIYDKLQSYRKTGWKLPSWDIAILETIEAFAKGEISESEAGYRIGDQKQRAINYRKNKRR